MELPAHPVTSAARASLIGTLLAVGLMLAMLTAGVTLIATTQSEIVPTAHISAGLLHGASCPASLRHESARHDHGSAPSRFCQSLAVENRGSAAGLAVCTIGEIRGIEPRFIANGSSVYSAEIGAHSTENFLLRVDDLRGEGAGKDAVPLVIGCRESVPSDG